jgi:hypothetical protein
VRLSSGPFTRPPTTSAGWRGGGVLLLLAVAAAHLAVLLDGQVRAEYLDAGLLVIAIAAVVTAAVLAVRAGQRVWQLAAALVCTSLLAFLIGHGVGWPGGGADVDRWSSPDGWAVLGSDGLVLVVAAWPADARSRSRGTG